MCENVGVGVVVVVRRSVHTTGLGGLLVSLFSLRRGRLQSHSLCAKKRIRGRGCWWSW